MKTFLFSLLLLFVGLVDDVNGQWVVKSGVTVMAHLDEPSDSSRQGSHYNAYQGFLTDENVSDRSQNPNAYKAFDNEVNVRYLIASGHRNPNDYSPASGAIRGLWDGKIVASANFLRQLGNNLTLLFSIKNDTRLFPLSKVTWDIVSSDPNGFFNRHIDFGDGANPYSQPYYQIPYFQGNLTAGGGYSDPSNPSTLPVNQVVVLARDLYIDADTQSGSTAEEQIFNALQSFGINPVTLQQTLTVKDDNGAVLHTETLPEVVTILPAQTIISQQPQPQEVRLGFPVTLEVKASGFELAFQWLKDGQVVDGATDSKLVFASVGQENAGLYTVRITNSFNQAGFNTGPSVVTSDAAALSIALPPVPQIVSESSSNIAVTETTLSASVIPFEQGGQVHFEYGEESAGYTDSTPLVNLAASASAQTLTQMLSGLKAGTRYVFKVVVVNPGGTSVQAGTTFETSPKPTIISVSSSNVSITGATLSASVIPFEQGGQVQFEYGPEGEGYTNLTPLVTLLASTTSQTVTQQLNGLRAHVVYHFRVVANNPGGTSNGQDQSFETLRLTDPFGPVAGSYDGLVYDSNDSPQGFMRTTVTKTGLFTAVIVYGGRSYVVRKRFDQDGKWSGDVRAANGSTIHAVVFLTVDVYNGTKQVTGSILDPVTGESLSIKGDSFLYSRTNPAPQAGTYTVSIKAPTQAGVPSGYGWAKLTVNRFGGAVLAGNLADGARISRGMHVVAEGTLPFYSRLYVGRGLHPGTVAGAITFANKTASDLDGDLFWQKPFQTRGYYAGGFETSASVEGAHFALPTVGQTALPQASYNLSALCSSMSSEVLKTVRLLPNSHFLVEAPAEDRLAALVYRSGLIGGSFWYEGRHIGFHGVINQKSQKAMGYFLDAATSGAVEVWP